jgi:hypothetical protein
MDSLEEFRSSLELLVERALTRIPSAADVVFELEAAADVVRGIDMAQRLRVQETFYVEPERPQAVEPVVVPPTLNKDQPICL